MLLAAPLSFDGYKSVVVGNYANSLFSDNEKVCHTGSKCVLLKKIALDKLNGTTRVACCEKAIKLLYPNVV